MALPDFTTLDYLRAGTQRQQLAYAELHQLRLWPALRPYDPVLAGTIPLGVDVAGSDLDVICEVPLAAQETFAALLRTHYGTRPGFQLRHDAPKQALVCSFWGARLEVEVFGQPRPVRQQHAYRHLLLEAAVLASGGERWRAAVHQFRQQGLKTEPAFARLLGLPGDPYAALLTLEALPPAALAAFVAGRTAHLPAPDGPG